MVVTPLTKQDDEAVDKLGSPWWQRAAGLFSRIDAQQRRLDDGLAQFGDSVGTARAEVPSLFFLYSYGPIRAGRCSYGPIYLWPYLSGPL